MSASLLVGLLAAVAIGGALSAYLWLVHRKRVATAVGLRILSAMRWREFSKLVVDALQANGFDASGPLPQGAQQEDLILQRDGQRWLLVCKQGLAHRVTPAVMAEVSAAMRFNAVSHAIIATTGRIDEEARKQANGMELVDGAQLWPLVNPLLPRSVDEGVSREADQLSHRNIAVACLGALAVGFAISRMVPVTDQGTAPAGATATTTLPAAASGARAAAGGVPLAPAPLSEDEQRATISHDISELAGIDRAAWSTRSTLVIYLDDNSDTDHTRDICAIVERHDVLRASRLQLQPPAGSTRPVRFIQCRAF